MNIDGQYAGKHWHVSLYLTKWETVPKLALCRLLDDVRTEGILRLSVGFQPWKVY